MAIAVLLMTACALPSHESNASEDKIADLIEARLALMKDVAAYKFLNDIAIEDKEREAVVLSRAVDQAEAAGLDGASVAPFFTAQIDAAKVIQQCWFVRWRQDEADIPEGTPDLQNDIRPRLIDIGNDLVTAIADLAAEGAHLDRVSAPRLECLPNDKAEAITTSLSGVFAATD